MGQKLDEYLKFASYEVLGHAGNISHEKALEKAEAEYEKYRIKQDKSYISDFDEVVLRSSKGIKVRKLKINKFKKSRKCDFSLTFLKYVIDPDPLIHILRYY